MDDLYIPIDRTLYPTKNYDVSKDGKYVAFYARSHPTTSDHQVHVCSCESGGICRLWSGPTTQCKKVTLKFFSHGEELMLMVASRGDGPGENLPSIHAALNGSLQKFTPLGSFPFKIEISSNGDFAAMESSDGKCKVMVTETLEILDEFEVNLLRFCTDVVGLRENRLVICPVGSSPDLRPTSRHAQKVLSMDCSPDGKLLASGDRGGLLVLWNLTNGEQLYDYKMDGELNSVLFSADSSLLLLNLRGGEMDFIFILHIASYELTEIWKARY